MDGVAIDVHLQGTHLDEDQEAQEEWHGSEERDNDTRPWYATHHEIGATVRGTEGEYLSERMPCRVSMRSDCKQCPDHPDAN